MDKPAGRRRCHCLLRWGGSIGSKGLSRDVHPICAETLARRVGLRLQGPAGVVRYTMLVPPPNNPVSASTLMNGVVAPTVASALFATHNKEMARTQAQEIDDFWTFMISVIVMLHIILFFCDVGQ